MLFRTNPRSNTPTKLQSSGHLPSILQAIKFWQTRPLIEKQEEIHGRRFPKESYTETYVLADQQKLKYISSVWKQDAIYGASLEQLIKRWEREKGGGTPCCQRDLTMTRMRIFRVLLCFSFTPNTYISSVDGTLNILTISLLQKKVVMGMTLKPQLRSIEKCGVYLHCNYSQVNYGHIW